jgi:hypothetical protein
MSFNDPWVIEKVGDCPRPRPVNLEVNLDHEIIRRLKYFSKAAEITPTAYVQRLLYHVYVTQEISHSEKKIAYTIRLSEIQTSLPKFRKIVND